MICRADEHERVEVMNMKLPIERLATVAALSLLAACNPNRDPGPSPFTAGASEGESGPTSNDETSSSTGNDSNTGNETTGDGDGDDSSSGPLLDVLGNDEGNETNNPAGCEKVDFLFVIDNSGSMTEEQLALVTSFPGFISTISDTLMAQDYHLMATDTDAASVGASSVSVFNNEVLCEPHPTCCQGACNGVGGIVLQPPPVECNNEPCANFPLPTGCDAEIGAGKNTDQQDASCGIDGDLRFMVATQTDLAETFACAALVGSGGDGLERPMDAMIAAVGEHSDVGGCNEGFLRDDAVLVVTVISDEDDVDQSAGDPASWKQFLVDAKGGNEEAIVVLGLVADGAVQGGQCPANEDAPALRSFAESFTHGQIGSVCAADYAPFFAQAVSVIDTACDEFVPVG
jgi:hypothetical protein